MALTNRYPSPCRKCGKEVPAGAGTLTGPPWVTRCRGCAGAAPAAPAAPRVRLALTGGRVVAAPTGYLGGDLFTSYRAACERAGARYEAATRSQVGALDAAPALAHELAVEGFAVDLDPALAAALEARAGAAKADVEAAAARAATVDAALASRGGALYPFQREGVRWLAPRSAALLADDMGLGKTVQVLAALPEGAPVLVVGPAVAKGVWRREVGRWRPDLRVETLSGRGSFRWPGKGEVVVTNYDILPSDAPPPPAGVVLVLDEAHAVKSPKAARTVRARALSTAVRAAGGRTWVLTATPLANHPPDLYAVLEAAGLAREAFGSWPRFATLYGGRQESVARGIKAWVWSGRVAPDATEGLRRVMLRRRKDDVLRDLPALRVQDVQVNGLDRATLRACDAAVAALAEAGLDLEALDDAARLVAATRAGTPGFEAVSRARAALATAKTAALLELVEADEEAGEATVVFSAHRAPIDALASRPGWAVITGDTPPAERTAIEDRFQRGELKGVAATIQAGGVAITLTRACIATFVDLAWTPGLNSQARDRIRRIGQDRPVLIRVLSATHAVDSHVNRLLAEKLTVLEAGLDAAAVREGGAPDLVAAIAALAATAPAPAPAPALAATAPAPAPAPAPAAAPAARRPAATARERWAEAAIRTLAIRDADRARELNGLGFSKADSEFGHSLAARLEGGLTDRQWAAAEDLAARYHRQVGAPPRVKE